MNIIIAGATGYLGSRLVERLCSYPPPPDRHNILLILRDESRLSEILRDQRNVSICNINDEFLQNRIREFSPDIVFCTTCCYETDPEYLYKTVDANYVFPAQILQIAATLGTKLVRFISIGTSLPSSLNLYSLTKKHFAELGVFFQQAGRIEFINLHLESFYGINEPKNRFVTRSVLQLKFNQDLLLTEGTQRRDYIFIDDVIEVLYFLLDCKKIALLADSGYNIPVGTGIAPSIKEIILFLSEEIHSQSKLKFGAIEMRKNEPSTKADLSILRKLGFSRSLTFWQDGMRQVIGSIK
ncbi:hypothetical protein FACS1894163_05260 [Spirochaetia bacterium]|nr:hypothetical protein FACS1894163_05260 [Spirochaetia bacterium]